MTWTLAHLTLRECFRRPFPYVVAGSLILLVLASRLFLAFTFGREHAESLNLAISAAFLAGFAVSALLGTTLVRRDFERKTLGWLFTKPVAPAHYVLGRLLGLLAASVLTAALVSAGSAPILVHQGSGLAYSDVLVAALRTLAPMLVMTAAAIAFSAIASRVVAPLLMLGLFLAGSLFGGGAVPAFALFSLDANATAPGPLALLYGLVFCSIFAVFAYIVLAIRLPANRQD